MDINKRQYYSKCIDHLQICAKEFDKTITIVSNELSSLLERTTNEKDKDNIIKDIAFITKRYYPNVLRFKAFTIGDINENNFEESLDSIKNLLTVIVRSFTTKIIPIIDTYNINDVGSRIRNLPIIITQVLNDIKGIIQINSMQIEKYKNSLVKRYSNDINSNVVQEGWFDNFTGGFGNFIVNFIKVLTSKDKTLEDGLNSATNNINALNNRMRYLVNRHDGIKFIDIKDFFTSNEFAASLGGVCACIGILLVIKKLIKAAIVKIKAAYNA